MKKEKVYRSSGNVFADLGLPDADEYLAKSELAVQIFKIIKSRRLTQVAAGKLLGISQPKVSALINGRLDGFSTDRLFRFLNALGCDVRISVSAASPTEARPGAGVGGVNLPSVDEITLAAQLESDRFCVFYPASIWAMASSGMLKLAETFCTSSWLSSASIRLSTLRAVSGIVDVDGVGGDACELARFGLDAGGFPGRRKPWRRGWRRR